MYHIFLYCYITFLLNSSAIGVKITVIIAYPKNITQKAYLEVAANSLYPLKEHNQKFSINKIVVYKFNFIYKRNKCLEGLTGFLPFTVDMSCDI